MTMLLTMWHLVTPTWHHQGDVSTHERGLSFRVFLFGRCIDKTHAGASFGRDLESRTLSCVFFTWSIAQIQLPSIHSMHAY
jgi:hypothetical protein